MHTTNFVFNAVIANITYIKYNYILFFYAFRSLAQVSLLFGQAVKGMSSGARVFEVKHLKFCWNKIFFKWM